MTRSVASGMPEANGNKIHAHGEMADRVRAKDWAATPLGALETWSQSTALAVNLMLGCAVPTVLYLGPQGTVLYNDEARFIFAEKHPAALGECGQTVWSEAWHIVGPQIDGVLGKGMAQRFENVLVPLIRDGRLQDLYWTYSYSPVYAEDGSVAGVFNVVQEMTESVLATHRLRESEELSSRILQSIGDAVIVTDSETRVTRMNAVAEQLTGWPLDEARGRPLVEVFHIVNEATRALVESPAAKVKRLGTIVGLANHTALIGRNGHETHIDDSGAPVWDQHGQLSGIVVVFRDIKERRVLEKQREESLLESRANEVRLQLALSASQTTQSRMQSALDYTGQGQWQYDASTSLVSADVVGRQLLHMPSSSINWRAWADHIVEEDRAHVSAAFAECIRSRAASDIDFRIHSDEGKTRWIRSRAQPINGQEEPLLLVGLCEDISYRKSVEDALRQTEKLAAVGRLAASIAHEINNPLESVTNLLYLARHSPDPAEVNEYLDLAERELRRVSSISSQTLRFYKQSSRPVSVVCEDLIESVLSIYQGRLINSRVQVEKRKRAYHPVLCFDGEIRQVLNNLVGNAIDAMHSTGGRLLLRSREGTHFATGRPGLVLTIADTGSGMSHPVLKRIFEPFYTTKGIGGTGLGLWISEEIVLRHGGTLHVRSSQQEGRSGTVFTLFLPFEAVIR